jgi:hypothetical protein
MVKNKSWKEKSVGDSLREAKQAEKSEDEERRTK